jgi:hypothetical protein
MKVGDLVKFESDVPESQRFWTTDEYVRTGIVVAELPGDAPAVSVLWASGEIAERVPPRMLKVLSESR